MARTRRMHGLAYSLAGMLLPALILATDQAPAQAPEQEDAGSKGDVSTENSPNLGQQKEQTTLQGEADGPGGAGKKNQETGRERQNTNSPTANRTERPQRIERPPRPERPHR